MKMKIASIVLGLSLLAPAFAHADQIFGDFKRLPDDVERGFSVGADFGALFLTGDKRTAQNPGFQLAFTTGYDIMKYLTIEGIYILGIQVFQVSRLFRDIPTNTFLRISLLFLRQLPLSHCAP